MTALKAALRENPDVGPPIRTAITDMAWAYYAWMAAYAPVRSRVLTEPRPHDLTAENAAAELALVSLRTQTSKNKGITWALERLGTRPNGQPPKDLGAQSAVGGFLPSISETERASERPEPTCRNSWYGIPYQELRPS